MEGSKAVKTEGEWVRGGCSFKWGPGKASLGVITERNRGAERMRQRENPGKGIPSGSITQAHSHQITTQTSAPGVRSTYKDDLI